MISFEDLVDEIKDVRDLFDPLNIVRLNGALRLLELGFFEKAQLEIYEVLKTYNKGLYSNILRNWIFIIATLKNEGYLISKGNEFMSFKELLDRDFVRLDKDKDTIKKVSKHLTGKLYLPDYIETIESSSFAETALNEVIMTDNVKNIGVRAFFAGLGLRRVTIPRDIEMIHNSCFENCTFLEKVEFNDSLKTIKNSAFRNCKSLREISLGTNINLLEDYCFRDCINLEKAEVKGTYLHFIGKQSFENCIRLKDFDIDSDFIRIDENAFRDCKNCTINIYSDRYDCQKDSFAGCKDVKRYMRLDFEAI